MVQDSRISSPCPAFKSLKERPVRRTWINSSELTDCWMDCKLSTSLPDGIPGLRQIIGIHDLHYCIHVAVGLCMFTSLVSDYLKTDECLLPHPGLWLAAQFTEVHVMFSNVDKLSLVKLTNKCKQREWGICQSNFIMHLGHVHPLLCTQELTSNLVMNEE